MTQRQLSVKSLSRMSDDSMRLESSNSVHDLQAARHVKEFLLGSFTGLSIPGWFESPHWLLLLL